MHLTYGVNVKGLVGKALKTCGATNYLKNDEIQEMLIPIYTGKAFMEKVVYDHERNMSLRRYYKMRIVEDVIHFAKQLNSEDTLYRRVKAYCLDQPKNTHKRQVTSPISMRQFYKDYQRLTQDFQQMGLYKDLFFDAYVSSNLRGDFTGILENALKTNRLYWDDFLESLGETMSDVQVEVYTDHAYRVVSALIIRQIPVDAHRIIELLMRCRDDSLLMYFSKSVLMFLTVETKGLNSIPLIDSEDYKRYIEELKTHFHQWCYSHLNKRKRKTYCTALLALHPFMLEAYCYTHKFGVPDSEREAFILAHMSVIIHHMQMKLVSFDAFHGIDQEITRQSKAYLEGLMKLYDE